MNVRAIADSAEQQFYGRMRCEQHPTSVRVTMKDGTDLTSPLCTLHRTDDGALVVESIYDGSEVRLFEAGEWREGIQYLPGGTVDVVFTPAAAPDHEFDNSDLALGREE